MKNLIEKITSNKDIEEIFNYVLDNLYKKGPTSISDMEILSYLSLYQPERFEEYRDSILNYIAIFYKETEKNTLRDVVFGQYRKHLQEKYNKNYTPVQANIINGISNNKCFSFSAPTSTGKSFVFLDQILGATNDVVVVVPSRALINEYYLTLNELVTDKSINILTFIDKINTRHANRNIFIVTPERCRELFKNKESFQVDLFLFDEAQLSNENSKRGLYFDSIVRRCYKAYPNSKFVFAHPFVKNPESQIQKNHFDRNSSFAIQYTQKNIGQIFMYVEDNWKYFHFGIDKSIMGNIKKLCDFDPIENAIKNGGSILIYVSKSKIKNKKFLKEFGRYIDLCKELESDLIDFYIEQIKKYTGGQTVANKNYYSQATALLRRGIVIHHGSLPLQTRLIVEQFTRENLCRICFATSTLEQGVNMPFDVVFLDRLESSKSLSVKNLIGRAGRSTNKPIFDFGYVIVKSKGGMSKLRNIMTQDDLLDNISALEKEEQGDDDYNNFKEAILNDTFNDEYNLTNKDIEKITTNEINQVIRSLLNTMFSNGNLITLKEINDDLNDKLQLYSYFQKIYSIYLGRDLVRGEQNVLNTAIKIIIWKVYGKTFKNICWLRYSFASKSRDREIAKRSGSRTENIYAGFYTEYKDLPDKTINAYNSLEGTEAKNVDYDYIMYDTYDYIDKLIGFKLSDIYYAAFHKYFERTNNTIALKLANYIKYGTENERHIWMLRYGLSFEDIEVLDPHIEEINSEGIRFKNTIYDLPNEDKSSILRFLY